MGLGFVVFATTFGVIVWFTAIGMLAAVGVGEPGVVSVTDCKGSTSGDDVCYGDFTPDDGGAARKGVRVDGVGYVEGKRVKARMVVGGRVQASGSLRWVTGLIGIVVTGAVSLIFGLGFLAQMGWAKPRKR